MMILGRKMAHWAHFGQNKDSFLKKKLIPFLMFTEPLLHGKISEKSNEPVLRKK